MSHFLRRPQVPSARSKCYSGVCVAVFCGIISPVIKSSRSTKHVTKLWGIDAYKAECCTYSMGAKLPGFQPCFYHLLAV